MNTGGQWWRSSELRNLLAHYLVAHGHVDTVQGLLAFYEHPEEWESEMRDCLSEMAAGGEREPFEPVAKPAPTLRSQRPVPFRVGVRPAPVVQSVPAQDCLFEVA